MPHSHRHTTVPSCWTELNRYPLSLRRPPASYALPYFRLLGGHAGKETGNAFQGGIRVPQFRLASEAAIWSDGGAEPSPAGHIGPEE